jgi:hypothetical protein
MYFHDQTTVDFAMEQIAFALQQFGADDPAFSTILFLSRHC